MSALPILPISVFIIARNEADRIGVAIASVKNWVDEVLVIDSGSQDDTVALSESLGARVIFNEWRGYGPQKVFGESLCRNRWVLNLDADEEISPELRDEIIGLFAKGEPECSAYRMLRTELYNFHDQPHPWAPTSDWVRLYRKDKAGFKDSPVHDSVVLDDNKLGNLRGRMFHRSFRSYYHHIEKVNLNSNAQADYLFNKGRNPSWLALLFTPPLAFLKSFILRREFVNGIDGVLISYMFAFQRFIRLAKTRERFLQQRNREAKPEDPR
jgi:glycosyltransferase involved in cell wall biosynthesis